MAATLKLSIATLVVLVLCHVTATPVERERRFLNSLLNGFASTFNRFFGDKFQEKDKGQALRDSDAIRGYAYTLGSMGEWYETAAEGYRRSMYHQAAQPELNEWRTAASLLTQLGDELLQDDKDLTTANVLVRETITGIHFTGNKATNYRTSLHAIQVTTARMEDLLPKVQTALTKLMKLADATATEDIDLTLKKVAKTDEIIVNVRDRYQSLTGALGLD